MEFIIFQVSFIIIKDRKIMCTLRSEFKIRHIIKKNSFVCLGAQDLKPQFYSPAVSKSKCVKIISGQLVLCSQISVKVNVISEKTREMAYHTTHPAMQRLGDVQPAKYP